MKRQRYIPNRKGLIVSDNCNAKTQLLGQYYCGTALGVIQIRVRRGRYIIDPANEV